MLPYKISSTIYPFNTNSRENFVGIVNKIYQSVHLHAGTFAQRILASRVTGSAGVSSRSLAPRHIYNYQRALAAPRNVDKSKF